MPAGEGGTKAVNFLSNVYITKGAAYVRVCERLCAWVQWGVLSRILMKPQGSAKGQQKGKMERRTEAQSSITVLMHSRLVIVCQDDRTCSVIFKIIPQAQSLCLSITRQSNDLDDWKLHRHLHTVAFTHTYTDQPWHLKHLSNTA